MCRLWIYRARECVETARDRMLIYLIEDNVTVMKSSTSNSRNIWVLENISFIDRAAFVFVLYVAVLPELMQMPASYSQPIL